MVRSALSQRLVVLTRDIFHADTASLPCPVALKLHATSGGWLSVNLPRELLRCRMGVCVVA